MDGGDRSTQFNFLRRTEMAFREYEAARQMTMALDNPSPDAVAEYFIAIGHWEVFLSQAYQAWCLLGRELPASGYKFFTKNDGSLVQRLNLLYNRAKHAEKAITAQQLPPGGTLPVWLQNDGLHCADGALTFEDMAEILRELALWADAAQDPRTMREKFEAYYRSASSG